MVPEIALYQATEITPLWQAAEDWLEREGLDPPFWAFAWAGG
ncbi:MAG: methyltransferase, partial [Lentisphaeria bacterium]|nr:methyltransferase [Lentisphaeria bacterium]